MTVSVELEKNRHSMAHILAQSLLRLYPNAKLGIGPVVENGFYYEIESEREIRETDFPRIEREMNSIVKENYPITQIFLSKEDAYNLLLHQGQIYKTEILNEIDAEEVSLYKTGEEFIDLCSGPHIPSTGSAGYFKLIKIEDGHWLNKEDRPVMQRIYGVGFTTKLDLIKYLTNQEQLKELDHKRVGPKLELFDLNLKSSIGMPVWLPKGKSMKNAIMNYVDFEKVKAGYQQVQTPNLIPSNTFISAPIPSHLKNKLLNPVRINGLKFYLRNDVTGSHYHIYREKSRSYRELPFKISEFAEIFRNEDDSLVNGLLRSKTFTMDANDVFCSEDQVLYEIINAYQLATKILAKLGFRDYKVQLSTDTNNQDKRYLWAEHVMTKVIESLKLVSRKSDDAEAEFGPRLEIYVKDVFGKEWKISSIQLDIFSTVKNNLHFVNTHNSLSETIVLHTSFIGSIERMCALLIERFAGKMPLWLAPEQIRVLPISKRYNVYSEIVLDRLRSHGWRCTIDKSDETLQSRIKKAQSMLIPYMVILGSKEEASQSISVRPREGQDIGLMKIDEFMEMLINEINS